MKTSLFLAIYMAFIVYDAGAVEYMLNEDVFCSENLDYEMAMWLKDFICKDKDGNLFNGQIVEYFDDGTIKKTFYVKSGIKNGEFLHYYDSGQVRSRTNWNNGLLEGVYETYYKNGNVESSAMFQKDKLNGVYKEYNETGDVKRIKVYENSIQLNVVMCEKQLVRGCYKILEDAHLLNLDSGKTTYIQASRSASVIGIRWDGVIVEEKHGTPKKWFLYTDEKYAKDDYISSRAYYEYVGTYEYKQPNGEMNRLHAFKEIL